MSLQSVYSINQTEAEVDPGQRLLEQDRVQLLPTSPRTDTELSLRLQQGLGLTRQQEALLLEIRHALLSNLGALTAERNALCQQLNVSSAARLAPHLHTQSLCCSRPASQVRAA